MPSRKSAAANNRHLFGNAHGANGKGSKTRVSNPAAYVANFPEGMGREPVRGKYRRVYGTAAVQRPRTASIVIH